MSKEVQMTFRIEPELRTAFAEAALQEDRPAAQVLRELMRAYVTKSRLHVSNVANDAMVGLEGFLPSREGISARQIIQADVQLATCAAEHQAFPKHRTLADALAMPKGGEEIEFEPPRSTVTIQPADFS